jgi:hypothetical protein
MSPWSAEYGPNPNEVIDRIRCAAIPTVMGNYDDGVGFDRPECGCAYRTPDDRSLGDLPEDFAADLDEAARRWRASRESAHQQRPLFHRRAVATSHPHYLSGGLEANWEVVADISESAYRESIAHGC